MKRFLALLLTLTMIISAFVIVPTAVNAAEDYRAWAQKDSRWSSIRLGSSPYTIGSDGCLVSSITKLIIQAGFRSADSFNIGTLANWLNSNGGYTSGGLLYWAKPSACVSGFNYYGNLLDYGTYNSSSYNSQLISWVNSGYHITLQVSNGNHWIAIDEAKTKATGEVYIMDSSYDVRADLTLSSRYGTFNSAVAYTGGTSPNPGPSFTPADIGTGFYASIDNTKSAKPIIASGNNVVLGEMSGEQNQIWRFDKQNDTSYRITNVATGTCLDDANYGTANETNIQVCASNDTTAQRWYLKVVGSGYSLVPKCALNSCIDVQGGVLTSGQNIQLFQQNGSNAQIFSISPRPSFNAVNKGDTFTAAIIFNATGSAVTAFENNNVGTMSYTEDNNQLWNFERMGNRSYKITNVATGKCLDDENFGTADKTNIQVCQSNNTTAQRWFLKAVEDGFSLAPQCALNSCIDSYNGGTNDGQNIYLWTQNATSAQIVSLRYVISPDYEVTFQGHEYKLYNRALPWREAYKFCEQQGGHLITINSDDEQVFISKLISEKATGSYLWLGATDSYEEGNWKWITGEKITYKNWADSEPNNYNDEDYMSIYKNSGKWNDGMDIYYSDTKAYSFICEFDENVVDCSLEKAFDYNGHRYEVYNNSVDWQTAKRICEQKGGHLVTITSSEENNAVKNNTQGLTNERYWLGLTDISLQSKWKWTTGEPLSYKNWSSGEPNNVAGIENYAEFVSTNGSWNDLRGFACTSLNIGFICEYDDIKDNILGDVDGDGDVEIRDSTWIQRHVAKEEMPFVINKATADVDGDGEITVMDVTAIQYYLANMTISYKIGEEIE